MVTTSNPAGSSSRISPGLASVPSNVECQIPWSRPVRYPAVPPGPSGSTCVTRSLGAPACTMADTQRRSSHRVAPTTAAGAATAVSALCGPALRGAVDEERQQQRRCPQHALRADERAPGQPEREHEAGREGRSSALDAQDRTRSGTGEGRGPGVGSGDEPVDEEGTRGRQPERDAAPAGVELLGEEPGCDGSGDRPGQREHPDAHVPPEPADERRDGRRDERVLHVRVPATVEHLGSTDREVRPVRIEVGERRRVVPAALRHELGLDPVGPFVGRGHRRSGQRGEDGQDDHQQHHVTDERHPPRARRSRPDLLSLGRILPVRGASERAPPAVSISATCACSLGIRPSLLAAPIDVAGGT